MIFFCTIWVIILKRFSFWESMGGNKFIKDVLEQQKNLETLSQKII